MMSRAAVVLALLAMSAGCDRVTVAPPSRVMDGANILSKASEDAINQRSISLEKATSDQLVVMTVPALNGAAIEDAARDAGNRMGLGQAKLNNGVLVMVAPNDRKVRIAVGDGLRGLLTDSRAATIVDRMMPMLRQAQYSDAVVNGVGMIDEVLRSDTRRPQYEMVEKAA